MKIKLPFLLSIFILIGCNKDKEPLFTALSSESSGIHFSNNLTESNDQNILDYLYYYNGGGVSIGDINNDNLPDIFFSGNQVKNRLYLNKGNLKFEDISATAGVEGGSSWNTGSVMGDVNGDGLLDIYVCAVVGINGFNGQNELFINNGDQTFTESAAKYGLDFDSYSSSAAFLDYDLDGDLDMYLLNHAVHTQESFGRADLRNRRNYSTGDKLLRNDGDHFTDVSEAAGIFGGVNGYGLGLAVSDFNMDGWPDIYVGNDFHEDDYYYLNNHDGTFSENSRKSFGHTSRFSMGNDVADINHDGFPDLISLDMLSDDEQVLKSSEADDNVQMQKMRIENLGYNYQFTRNMLQINQSGENFSETALMSGIAATDWSWSALFGDYDMDGEQDLFVTNGIPKRPNNLDYIKYLSNDQIRNKISNTRLVDQKALDLMPSGKAANFMFKGEKNLQFKNVSKDWLLEEQTVSTAAAYGDLDNDGDLDLVINNINAEPEILINNSEKGNFLEISFKGKVKNTFAVGAKVFSYANDTLQYKELTTTRGFQSSSQPIIHFGYGKVSKVDSLVIVWPNNSFQVLKKVKTNQHLVLEPFNTKPDFNYSFLSKKQKLFEPVEGNLGINFNHREDNYIDFNAQKLIPYKISDRGPATIIGDLNNDSKKDIFFGSSKYASSAVYIFSDSGFVKTSFPEFQNDSITEDVSGIIADFNNDKKNDLYIGTAGGNFSGKAKPLLDKEYLSSDSSYIAGKLPEIYGNSQVIKASDFDKDGDIDLFIGSNAVSYDFGKIPESFLLKNNNGEFSKVINTELTPVGMITDAVWTDFDRDGWEDLIVVGEWMQPTFFRNNKGKLEKADLLQDNYSGLWQAIEPFDIDGDGDVDYLLGNWGTNSKFTASDNYPLKMYYSDFDSNGTSETIVTVQKNGKYYTLENMDELSSQMSTFMHKKFTNYQASAGKTAEEIFGKDLLNKADLFEVNTLQSGYLKNEKGNFSFVPFDNNLQISPILTFLTFDFDNDGKKEVLAAGNYFGVKPYHGRFDSFPGAIIKSEKEIYIASDLNLDLKNKSVRHLNVLEINNKKFLLVTVNNGPAEVYKLTNYN